MQISVFGFAVGDSQSQTSACPVQQPGLLLPPLGGRHRSRSSAGENWHSSMKVNGNELIYITRRATLHGILLTLYGFIEMNLNCDTLNFLPQIRSLLASVLKHLRFFSPIQTELLSLSDTNPALCFPRFGSLSPRCFFIGFLSFLPFSPPSPPAFFFSLLSRVPALKFLSLVLVTRES